MLKVNQAYFYSDPMKKRCIEVKAKKGNQRHDGHGSHSPRIPQRGVKMSAEASCPVKPPAAPAGTLHTKKPLTHSLEMGSAGEIGSPALVDGFPP